jgi:arsenate reductase-like glutaredoxin family protein
MKYLSDADKEEKLLENPQLIKTPVVRSGKNAVIGFFPEIWSKWE